MAKRRAKQRESRVDLAVAAASVALCIARCKAYAESAANKGHVELADVYDGFQTLLQEYAEDLAAGIVGRVEIDVVTL